MTNQFGQQGQRVQGHQPNATFGQPPAMNTQHHTPGGFPPQQQSFGTQNKGNSFSTGLKVTSLISSVIRSLGVLLMFAGIAEVSKAMGEGSSFGYYHPFTGLSSPGLVTALFVVFTIAAVAALIFQIISAIKKDQKKHLLAASTIAILDLVLLITALRSLVIDPPFGFYVDQDKGKPVLIFALILLILQIGLVIWTYLKKSTGGSSQTNPPQHGQPPFGQQFQPNSGQFPQQQAQQPMQQQTPPQQAQPQVRNYAAPQQQQQYQQPAAPQQGQQLPNPDQMRF